MGRGKLSKERKGDWKAKTLRGGRSRWAGDEGEILSDLGGGKVSKEREGGQKAKK